MNSKKKIVHQSTLEKVMDKRMGFDSSKPLTNKMEEAVSGEISFEHYMLLVYDHPMWRWN